MEKNWIKDVTEFVRKAMNKGLCIEGFYFDVKGGLRSHYSFLVDKKFSFGIYEDYIHLATPTGNLRKDINISKRDLLELDSILLSIEEYNEDIALSEFENFFNEESKSIDINDLNDDDD